MYFHKDHPFGKGIWIWKLAECLGGDIDRIITKCHDYQISYLLIKGGDGANLYPAGRSPQLTRELVARLQSANIKVYSWSYVYGEHSQAEAEVAIKCLELGVDGHVFDAEADYRDAPNNKQLAEAMLQTVRARYPDKFLAYAPLAIIDYHTNFPYTTFGKYCDAVMPQIYFGTMKKTPQQAVLWTYDNFVRWQNNWTDNDHADSVKPIIPIGQAYDDYKITPPYILTPADIHAFFTTVKGYKSASFWSFQHLLRDDCWEALRAAHLDAPSAHELNKVVTASEQPATTPADTPVEELVVETPTVQPVPQSPAASLTEEPTTVTNVTNIVYPAPATTVPSTTVTPQKQPQRCELPTNLSIPVSTKPTTVTFKPNKTDPDKVDVIVHAHKTHREYFVDAIRALLSVLKIRR